MYINDALFSFKHLFSLIYGILVLLGSNINILSENRFQKTSIFSNKSSNFNTNKFFNLGLDSWITSILIIIISFSINNATHYANSLINDLLFDNKFSIWILYILYINIIIYLLISYKKIKIYKTLTEEHFFFMLTAFLGSMIITSGNNIILLIIGIEIQNFSNYGIALTLKKHIKTSSSIIKFFFVNGYSMLFLIMSVSYFLILFGENANLRLINIFIIYLEDSDLSSIGFILLFSIIGFYIKLYIAPLGKWLPDLYNAIPVSILILFVIQPSLSIYVIINKFSNYAILYFEEIRILSTLLILYAFFYGFWQALKETNIIRLFSFSTVIYNAFNLLIFFFYLKAYFYPIYYVTISLIFYGFSSLGLFITLNIIQNKDGIVIKEIHHLKGLYRTNKAISFFLSLYIFSIAGTPPLAGFLSKTFIFSANTINEKEWFFFILLIIFSSLNFYYYLKIIKTFYFHNLNNNNNKIIPFYIFSSNLIFHLSLIILFVFFLFLFIIYPEIVSGLLEQIFLF